MVERVWTRPLFRTAAQAPGTLSKEEFQDWLSGWRRLQLEGWEASVVVALDGSHAVGLAWRP